jgi:hypothetical protein
MSVTDVQPSVQPSTTTITFAHRNPAFTQCSPQMNKQSINAFLARELVDGPNKASDFEPLRLSGKGWHTMRSQDEQSLDSLAKMGRHILQASIRLCAERVFESPTVIDVRAP